MGVDVPTSELISCNPCPVPNQPAIYPDCSVSVPLVKVYPAAVSPMLRATDSLPPCISAPPEPPRRSLVMVSLPPCDSCAPPRVAANTHTRTSPQPLFRNHRLNFFIGL